MEEQGAGRAINRHRFSLEEAEANLERPVVRALLQLMRFRNTHPAFNGQVPPRCCHVSGLHTLISRLTGPRLMTNCSNQICRHVLFEC